MGASTLRARAWSRVRTYRCRACAARFQRRRSHCPSCRTRKGEYGYGIRRITWL